MSQGPLYRIRLGFFGCWLVGLMLDGGHHGEGKHNQRDVTVPTMPGSGLVMIEPKFILGGLEAVLDRPAMALDTDQRFDRGSHRTPGGEVGEIAVSDMTPDQQTACPQATILIIELFCFKIGQFKVAPVIPPRPLNSRTGRQALPIGWSSRPRDFLGRTADWLRPVP